MIYVGDALIDNIILHKVGNKSQEEGTRFSKSEINVDDELKSVLLDYFMGSFKFEELFNFYHDSDINLNEVYQYISTIFSNQSDFYEQSINLAKHLYEKSTHPKVKAGEFYVVYFSGCNIGSETVDAIGLFKSESRDTFLKVNPTADSFDIYSEDGINISKLDKGCIIFNNEKEKGYMVATVDNLSKGNDALYWKDEFLKVRVREDEYFHTKNVMNMCKNFVNEHLPKQYEIDKADQADILNKSMKFLKEKETFDFNEFSEEVMQEPEMIDTLKEYKNTYEYEQDINISNEFEISNPAVKKQSRVFKSVIKLDKNFHIYVHGNRQYIQKGFDEEKGLNYYQVYFENEQ